MLRRSPRASRRPPLLVGAAAVASFALLGAGCGSSGVSADDTTASNSAPITSVSEPNVTASTSAAATVASSDPASSSTPTATSTDDGSFRKPNEVGQILQEAQDDIQRVSGDPVFVSHSHDLLGSRHQILDDDWKVCTQNVNPGAKASAFEHIDFGVVKTDETCP